jgi:Regulator of ribonuclease activity B
VPDFFGRKMPLAPNADPEQELIEGLRALGWNMSAERVVENFLRFATREAADRAAEQLGLLGYDVIIEPARDGTKWGVQANRPRPMRWGVQANRRRVIAIEVLRAQRAELIYVAASNDGEYFSFGVRKEARPSSQEVCERWLSAYPVHQNEFDTSSSSV